MYVRRRILEPHNASLQHRHVWLEALFVKVTEQIQHDPF
jgi:hypothetical protein